MHNTYCAIRSSFGHSKEVFVICEKLVKLLTGLNKSQTFKNGLYCIDISLLINNTIILSNTLKGICDV